MTMNQGSVKLNNVIRMNVELIFFCCFEMLNGLGTSPLENIFFESNDVRYTRIDVHVMLFLLNCNCKGDVIYLI